MIIENNLYNGKEHDIAIHKTKDANLNQIKTTKNDYEDNKGNVSSLNNDANTNINHKTEMLNTHLINHRNVNSVSYDTQNSNLNNNMKSYNKQFSTFKSLSNNHNNNNIVSKSTEAINLQPKNQLNQKKTFLLTVSSIDSNKNITTNTNNNISSNINTNRNSPYIPKETNNISRNSHNNSNNNNVNIKHLLLSQLNNHQVLQIALKFVSLLLFYVILFTTQFISSYQLKILLVH